MTRKERKILETFGRIVPTLSDIEKEKLLSFGEGMAFAKKVSLAKDAATGHQVETAPADIDRPD